MNCDICKGEIRTVYVDGATMGGPWANMCLGCFAQHGVGLGTGRGQQYKMISGAWKKVKG